MTPPPRLRGSASRSQRLLLPLAAALLGACGGTDDGAGTAATRALTRLALHAAEDAPALPGEAVVQRFDLPADEGWRVEGARAVPQATKGGRELLALRQPEGLRRLILPGSFDPAAFDVVDLAAVSPKGCWVTLRFSREGQPRVVSRKAWLDPCTEPRALRIEFAHLRFQHKPFDELQLELDGQGLVGVASVALLDVPLETLLPDPDGEAALYWIGAHARRGVGLSSRRPLEAPLAVDPAARLAFSYGITDRLDHPDREHPCALLVAVTDAEGGRREERIELPLRDPTPNGWTSASLALGGLAPGPGSVRFELEAPSDETALCVVAEASVVRPLQAPRTVVLVTSDTHRYDHVGVSERAVELATPALDALAARGVTFDDCFASTNVTNPSHVALMTATHPRDTGVLDNSSPIVDAAHTLAEAFEAAGYRTWASVSAVHLGDEMSGLGQGFDRMSIPYDFKRHPWIAERAVDELLGWTPDAEGAPLFVWLHLFDAHTPYEPPAPFDRAHYPKDRDPFDPSLPDPGLPQAGLPGSLKGLRDPAFPRAQYRSEVEYLDSQLARVFADGRLGAGVIAVTADHGENLGHHGIYYDHGNLYPDTIHVPMILAWPGAPAGRRVRAPVFQLDLGRVLLDLSELQDVEFPGRSWLPLIEQRPFQARPRFALAAHALSASVTIGSKHLILHLREHAPENFDRPRELHEVELFDLEQDPACQRDLVDERPELARTLRAQLVAWLEERTHTGWASSSAWNPDTAALMEQLGYAEGGEEDEGALFDPACACAWCRRFASDG